MTARPHDPVASSPQVRNRMRSTGRRDTEPEMAIRRELHRRGLRYRVDRRVVAELRRRADLLFASARVAVFIDGCFWHRCPAHRTQPVANASWWAAKLHANERRDRDTDRRLKRAGWAVLRIWEHEQPAAAARRIALIVRSGMRRGADVVQRTTAPVRRSDAAAAGRPRRA